MTRELAEICPLSLHDKAKVIWHKDISNSSYSIDLAAFCYHFQEGSPIRLSTEDLLQAIAPVHHMVIRARILYS